MATITFHIVVRDEQGRVIDQENASGNTLRTAQAAKASVMRWFELQYPPELYSIHVEKP